MIVSGELKIKVEIDNLEVIGCGMLHSTSGKEIIITLDNQMTLYIRFKKDIQKKLSRAAITPFENDSNKGYLDIYNFENSLGSGILEPMRIGDINNREVYFSFYTWFFTNDNRIINYVFYLGEQLNIEKNGD